LDTVVGIPGSRTEIVMLEPPDGGTRLELSSFVRPDHLPGSPLAPANELGLRNVAFEVEDLQAAVDRAATDGFALVGGIGEYEGIWKMAYVRGPEGIIVSLAECIGPGQRDTSTSMSLRVACGAGKRSSPRPAPSTAARGGPATLSRTHDVLIPDLACRRHVRTSRTGNALAGAGAVSQRDPRTGRPPLPVKYAMRASNSLPVARLVWTRTRRPPARDRLPRRSCVRLEGALALALAL
jgi:hypothetical protein